MSEGYTIWGMDTSKLFDEHFQKLVAHCDKKIDAYHAEHAKRQKRMIAETKKHNAVVEKYLAVMVKLIRVMERRR